MAVFSAMTNMRDGRRPSANNSAAFCNTVFSAFTSVGMIEVPEVEGTSTGTVVARAAGDGEVQVASPGDSNYTDYILAKRAFRHPQAGFVIVVDIVEKVGMYANSSGYTTLGCNVLVADGESSGVLAGAMSSPVKMQNGMTRDYSDNIWKASNVSLTSGCGGDYFWIYTDVSAVNQTDEPGNAKHPGGYSQIAMFIQKTNSGISLILNSPVLSGGSSQFAGANINEVASYRSYIYSGSVWKAIRNGGFGCLPTPDIQLSDSATRISQGHTILAGTRERLRVAFIGMGLVADCDIIEINLNGDGPSKYIAALGFGSGNPATRNQSVNSVDALLLPYEE